MVGSVNTNIGAQIALQNLNITGADLASVQKKISTGLRVSDANDNGAVFAIAQGLRSDISAITTVNGQLGAAKGVLQVTIAALTGIQNTVADIRSVLVQLADQNVTGNARTQLNAQYKTLFLATQNYAFGANYNGTNILVQSQGVYFPSQGQVPFGYASLAPESALNGYRGKNISVIQDIAANQYSITGGDFLFIKEQLQNVADATQAQFILSNNFVSSQNYIGTLLNRFAADSKFIDNQITFNNALSDATTQGLGALVDADLAKESARLQSLQIKQQLGTQSLGIANQSPQTLLGLFR
jgi:flagellin